MAQSTSRASRTPRTRSLGERGATTVDFAAIARRLSAVARRLGVEVPSFRCPPRLVGVDRSIRRRPNGAVVAVRVKGRPWPAVVSDMIEGVVAANQFTSPDADRLRAELWQHCQSVHDAAPTNRVA